nr:RICIN domain-containing protein [uncultured Cellulosilyticum sp.]
MSKKFKQVFKKTMSCLAMVSMFGTTLVSMPSVVTYAGTARQMEALDRGLIATKVSNGVYLSWRLLGTDNSNVGFYIYKNGTRLNSTPLTTSTNYVDTSGTTSDKYYVTTVINGVEKTKSAVSTVLSQNYLDIPLNKPAGMTMPDGSTCTYSANDASVGDVDGDGQYEIILKWDPSNSKDNSQSGYTGNVYLDAYEMDGTQLWRIDLGRNIRAGAHYTQFMVYDLDGDGKAEVACKTSDATVDGQGNVIGNANADYRNSKGYILTGNEYLTVFDGQTGGAITTIDYTPARGTVSSWGDSYGNRVDRFLACIAYLDGKTPSLVMCRGYYTRAVLVAYTFDGSSLKRQWTFDSKSSGNSAAAGQGNHNLSVADVDDDGYDEIIYGSATIDHNGSLLYTTGLGHGDALHVSDFDPDRAGLEVFQVHEDKKCTEIHDAATGKVLWKAAASNDVGRGIIGNFGSDYYPYIAMSTTGSYDKNGTSITAPLSAYNFAIWWDGDLYREILDKNYINKYNGATHSASRYVTFNGATSCNSTKATPSLQADLFGDWREEVVLPLTDSSALRIYMTTAVTDYRYYTFMHDPVYRLGIAWQNVAYNQPPHTSFYIGPNHTTQPAANLYTPGNYTEPTVTGGNTSTDTTRTDYATINDGWYYIKNVNAQKYLQVKDNVGANGQNVEIATGTGVAGQRWYVTNVGNGYVTLKNGQGYMLDVDYGKNENGTNIQTYTANGLSAQEFKLILTGQNNVYGIVARCTTDTKGLDAERKGTADGTNVLQYTYSGAANQIWVFESCSAPKDSSSSDVNEGSSSQQQDAVSVEIISDWSDGATGEVTITNTTGKALDGWTCTFTTSRPITAFWNATLISSDGNTYTITNPSWQTQLEAGESFTTGCAFGSGTSDVSVTNISLK